MESQFMAGDRVRLQGSGQEGMLLEATPASPSHHDEALAIVDMAESGGDPATHVPLTELELAEPHGEAPEKCIDV